jgi:hypothetical protein
MTIKPYLGDGLGRKSDITLGPRLRAEIERSIRELAGRFQPSGHDLRELSRLRALLKNGGDVHG